MSIASNTPSLSSDIKSSMVLLGCPWRNLSLMVWCECRTSSSSEEKVSTRFLNLSSALAFTAGSNFPNLWACDEEKVSTRFLNLSSALAFTAGSNFPNLWACDFSHSSSMPSLNVPGRISAVEVALCRWASQRVKLCCRPSEMVQWWTFPGGSGGLKSSGCQPVGLSSVWNWRARSTPNASETAPWPKAIWKAKLTSSSLRNGRMDWWVWVSEWNV